MDAVLWSVGLPLTVIVIIAICVGKSPSGILLVLKEVVLSFKNIFVR